MGRKTVVENNSGTRVDSASRAEQARTGDQTNGLVVSTTAGGCIQRGPKTARFMGRSAIILQIDYSTIT